MARAGSTAITAAAFALTLTAVVAVAAVVTDGFRAYTLESARRLQALRARPPVAGLRLETLDAGAHALGDYADRWLIVDFIYTRCETLCVSLGSLYARLQQRLAPDLAAGRVQLLSLSFDPGRDGWRELAAYRERHGRGGGWDLGRAAAGELPAWLERFGVVVIPDPWGGYTHNAALHLVGPDGRLRAIFDSTDVEGLIEYLRHARG
jgi:protein SCO1/2